MNVAVTGGAGQLGTLVLRRLVADRTVKRVTCVDLRAPRVPGAKLRAVRADVRDPDIGRHFSGCDAVVHLAFLVTASPTRTPFREVNVEGSKNVFRAAASAGAKAIVYASSIAAYGVVAGHPVPIVEDTPRVYQPGFAYSACKHEVEAFLDAFEAEHPGIAVSRLRPAILVGARMEHHPLGDLLRRRLLPDSGSAPLPIVWDEDAADAVLRILRGGARGAFNLAADAPLPAADLARAGGMRLLRIPPLLRRAATRGIALLARARGADPAWLEVAEVPMVVSSAKARAELGWRPRCATCADVIRRYADVAPVSLDLRLWALFRLLDIAGRVLPVPPEARPISARIHLQLTGPRGGDLQLLVDRGRLRVRSGIPEVPTSVLTLRAETLLDLLRGEGDTTAAQMTGKILLEGDPIAGMVLGGVVTQVRVRLGRFRRRQGVTP